MREREIKGGERCAMRVIRNNNKRVSSSVNGNGVRNDVQKKKGKKRVVRA